MSYQTSQSQDDIQEVLINPGTSTPSMTTGSQNNPTIIPDSNTIPSSFIPRKPKSRKPRGRVVDWSAEMTTVLVRELVQAIRTGKRSDNGF